MVLKKTKQQILDTNIEVINHYLIQDLRKIIFFFLKPFFGVEYTNDSASYFLTGIYFEDNLGELFEGNKSKLFFTPSFGAGIYNDGSGKKLGNDIQFRTSIEVSYELKNQNRIGISFSHISNANLGDKNPGVEILSFSYQIPH